MNPLPRRSLRAPISCCVLAVALAACVDPEEDVATGAEPAPDVSAEARTAGAPPSEAATPAPAPITQRYGDRVRLGTIACTSSAVRARLRELARDPFQSAEPGPVSFMWREHGSCSARRHSAVLDSDYVKCSYEVFAGLSVENVRRTIAETLIYDCGTGNGWTFTGRPYAKIAGDTVLYRVGAEGRIDDAGGLPGGDCYLSLKSDGRLVTRGTSDQFGRVDGGVMCFTGGSPVRRVGNAFVVVSRTGYNEPGYVFALFEQDRTTREESGRLLP